MKKYNNFNFEKLYQLISNIYIISIIKKVNVILFGIISASLLNRYLGPTLKGQYSYLLSVSSILIVIFNFGINLSYPNFKRKNDRDYLSLFFSISLFQFILFIIISLIVYFYTNNSSFLIILLFTSFGILRIQMNYITLVEEIKSHSIVTIISVFFSSLLMLIIFILTESNLIIAVIVHIIKDLLIIILSMLSLYKKIKKIDLDIKVWLQIAKFSFIPMYITLLQSINYRIDIIILRNLGINLASIGLYTVGVSLAEYGWLIPDTFKDVMINKSAKEDNISSMCFSLRLSSSLMLVMYVVVFLFGKQILFILFGNDFVDAYNVTSIIFIGVYFMIFSRLLSTLYIAKGQFKLYLTTLTISVAVNIVLNMILIPRIDITGAAISSVVSYAGAGLVLLFDFKKTYGLKINNLIFLNKKDIVKIINRFYIK